MKTLMLMLAALAAQLPGQTQNTRWFETTHWTARTPLGDGDVAKWTATTKPEDKERDNVYALVELYTHNTMNVIIRNTVLGGDCINYEVVVDHRFGKYSVRREAWTDNDCTRCCKNPQPSKRHPDLKRRVLPLLGELPEEIKKDLRPYLAAIGIRI